MIDPARDEVVVLNSNRFTVLDRIALPDPTELAMGPNLDLLAVSNRSAGTVAFIDIEPTSSTFHQVVHVTSVGSGPRGIAWKPGNEDVLVCCEGDDSVAILSTFDLQVRKVVRRGLDRPFAIAVTPRQANFGFLRNVYFAFVLDRAGHVSLFESGPSGVNGWGFDDLVGRTSFTFRSPKAIQPDPIRLTSGVWIAHLDQLDTRGDPTGLAGGAVSNLVLDSTTLGMIPLQAGETPSMRGLSFRVEASTGSDELTGAPLDLAFDDQKNLGVLPNPTSIFGSGAPAPVNGKNLVRFLPGSGVVNTSEPAYLFVPVRAKDRAPGAVDVIDLATRRRVDVNAYHAGVQSIPATGAALVMDYFRQ